MGNGTTSIRGISCNFVTIGVPGNRGYSVIFACRAPKFSANIGVDLYTFKTFLVCYTIVIAIGAIGAEGGGG